MKTAAKITFFILLSIALHLLLLPFNFMSTATPYISGQVGISYVAKSLDSFYPGAAAPKTNSRVESSPPRKAPSVKKRIPRHTGSDDVPVVVEIKPASPQPVIDQGLTPPVPTVSKVVDPLPEKTMKKGVPVEADLENIAAREHPFPAEQDLEVEAENSQRDLEVQPVKQNPVVNESLVAEDHSSSEVIAAQRELATDNQKLQISLSDQDDKPSDRTFREALPRYDVNPPPHYPQVAKLRGWEGKVVFEALIRKNGRVGRLKIKTSSGYRSLDTAARKAISRWKFSPATSFGLPKESEVEIPITFSLKDS